MWWRIGWIFNTLNYQVEKHLRESIRKNELILEIKWNFFNALIISAAKYPFVYLFLLILLFIPFTYSLYFFQPVLKEFLPQWHGWKEFMLWEGNILSGQLTIIGVIFPIVVGFVSILLQNQSANRALWKIYSRYSGFMFVGLSGLTLSVIIVLGQLFSPWLNDRYVVAFDIGIVLWFLFNLLLTIWFLFSTFQFVSLVKRRDITLRYSINESLISEIKSKLAQHIPMSAIVNLSFFSKKILSDENINIKYTLFSSDENYKYSIKFRNEVYLTNILYRPLSIFISCWNFINQWKSLNNKANLLALPIKQEIYGQKKWLIAETDRRELNNFEKLMLRISYHFSKKNRYDDTDFGLIIQAYFGNVEDSLRDNNIRHFEIALNDLVIWNNYLLEASSFIDENGNNNSWVLLTDATFFGHSLLHDISKEYYRINKTALEYLPKTNEFFTKLYYVFPKVYRANNTVLPNEIVNNLIRDHFYQWIALIDWKVNRGNDSGNVIENQYQSAINSYVGSWENWLKRLPDIENIDWNNIKEIVNLYLYHLQYTAELLISSVRMRESKPTLWASDMLIYWLENLYHRRERFNYYWKKDIINVSLLGKSTTSEIMRYIVDGHEFNNNDVIHIAIKNAWIDIQLVCVSFLLLKPIHFFTDENVNLMNAILNKKRLVLEDNVNASRTSIDNAGKILSDFIRQRSFFNLKDRSYSNWLNKIIEAFSRSEEPERVSGRIYTGWGSNTVNELSDSYLILTLSRSTSIWSLSRETIDFIMSNQVLYESREQIIIFLKSWLNVSEENIGKTKLLIAKDVIDDLLENHKKSISALIDILEEKNNHEIMNAPLDEEYLARMGEFASKSLLLKKDKPFPLYLFSNINYVNNITDENSFLLNITNYDKSYIIHGVGVIRLTDEDDWLDEMVRDNVSLNLFRSFINQSTLSETSFSRANDLLLQAVSDSKQIVDMNNTPVLFIGSWDVYNFIDSILWNYSSKEVVFPYSLKKSDGFPNEYICHIENIEVYKLPFSNTDFSILTSKENFDTVTINKNTDVRAVTVYYEDSIDDMTKGTLKLSYKLESTYNKFLAYKYMLKNDYKN